MKRPSEYTILLVAACLVVMRVSAQEPPRPLLVAAERINAVTPQAVAQQTIRLGTYNGATKEFAWALDPGYAPNIPDSKKTEYGGDVPPSYYADVNSYTVTYEIAIANKPPNFSLALVYPAPNGQVITKTASIAGNVARVDVSPPSSVPHNIKINQAGAPTLRFRPRLANQLGAFVVPYLLVSIIYEPPGKESKATYSVTTTAGTSVTLGMSRSSGFIAEPANTDTLMWVFNKVLGIYIQTVAPVAVQEALGPLVPQVAAFLADKDVGGALSSVFEGVGGVQTNTVQFIVDTTVSSSKTEGYVFSLTEGWATRPNDEFSYPGTGDVFFLMRDVVFLYVAYQGRIYMAPVAYAIDRGPVASELPAAIAQGYLSLDPHFAPKSKGGPVVAGSRDAMTPIEGVTLTGASGNPGSDARRFRRLPNQPCEKHATKLLEIVSTDYQIVTGSRAITQTTLERASGLVAAATGGTGTRTTSVTFTSATENYSSTSVAPKIEVACEGEAFEIEVFFDNLFGTFFTRRGPPLTALAAVTGQASDAQGRPRPNQLVTLTIGDRSYRVRSDASGSFQFRFSTIPVGTGTLSVGNQSYRISYAGSPKQVLLKGSAATERAAGPMPEAPVGVQVPGEVPTAKPSTQPTTRPTARPRRP